MSTEIHTPEVRAIRHPIRGLVGGFAFGVGLALLAIGLSFVALGTLPPALMVLGGTSFGLALSLVYPVPRR